MKRISKAEKVTDELIEMIQKGIINADDIPKLKDLANLVEIDPNLTHRFSEISLNRITTDRNRTFCRLNQSD
ncbi:hypothetical protein bcgnr5369_68620 [Bacillus cereus]